MNAIFHDGMLPSEFLQGWLLNDYLSAFPKDKSDFERYYRGYINGKFLSHTQNSYDRNLHPAISIVRNHAEKPLRLLEIGSSCGTESLYFSLIGCDVVGLELQSNLYRVAQLRKQIVQDELNRSLSLEFIKSSILDYDDKAKFDLIWMEQAFHHLEPRESMVIKIAPLLKSGGHLVISEVNAYNAISQISLMRERFRTHRNPFKTVIKQIDEDGSSHPWGHERILTVRKLTKLFLREEIVRQSVDYFKMLPNRVGLERVS